MTNPNKCCRSAEFPGTGIILSLLHTSICSQIRAIALFASEDRQLEWTEQQQNSFTELKECLVNPPVLAYPNFGLEAGELILDTDASTEKGIGAVLSEMIRWHWTCYSLW